MELLLLCFQTLNHFSVFAIFSLLLNKIFFLIYKESEGDFLIISLPRITKFINQSAFCTCLMHRHTIILCSIYEHDLVLFLVLMVMGAALITDFDFLVFFSSTKLFLFTFTFVLHSFKTLKVLFPADLE